MGRILLAAGLAIVALGVAAPAEAQISFGFGNSNGGGSITLGGGRGISGGMRVGNNFGMTIGGGGGWRPSRPSRPVHVGPTHITHYNPWTGRVDTHNNQINNTAFDFGRNQSMNNGTRRVVNRPVRDAWGNITGYERGVVWNNSFTGQEHGHTTVVRPNGTGGGSSTTVLRSVAPTAGRGINATSVAFAPRMP